eukprot:2479768-Heterocapsa_arctica.AAC.1
MHWSASPRQMTPYTNSVSFFNSKNLVVPNDQKVPVIIGHIIAYYARDQADNVKGLIIVDRTMEIFDDVISDHGPMRDVLNHSHKGRT